MMTRNDAIDLARAHALGHGQAGDHTYLPTTDAEAAEWLPHAWVVDAIVSAAEEREHATDMRVDDETILTLALDAGFTPAEEFGDDELLSFAHSLLNLPTAEQSCNFEPSDSQCFYSDADDMLTWVHECGRLGTRVTYFQRHETRASAEAAKVACEFTGRVFSLSAPTLERRIGGLIDGCQMSYEEAEELALRELAPVWQERGDKARECAATPTLRDALKELHDDIQERIDDGARFNPGTLSALKTARLALDA